MVDELFQEILKARQRVYEIGQPTPLERLPLPIDAEVFIKREDVSAVHSFKWRGAYNRMAALTDAERKRGVVTSSAGNHAQGVAVAARKLGVHATIFMPTSAPMMKQTAVAQHGGDAVKVVLEGDTYDDTAAAAKALAKEENKVFIHPYDDLLTIAGQGTLADEIVMSGQGPFDVAYIQIGGGGLAAGVACWLKRFYPGITIVGVEGVDQDSMAAAVLAGEPVTLDYVDVFCDGTAVKRAGDLTFELCRDLVDEFISVTNEEVCAAIQVLWETRRRIPEPSGAMGLAGLLTQAESLKGKKALCILCGSNMDFGKLGWVVRHAGIGAHRRRYFRFEIDERHGALLDLLNTVPKGMNIIEFQFGKTDEERGWPVIGFEGTTEQFELLERETAAHGVPFADVTSEADVEFRIIRYESHLFRMPIFIALEFPERAGALFDFMNTVRDAASICYFNYVFTGEQVGRALIGFEFSGEEDRERFREILAAYPLAHWEIGDEVLARVL
jgi:threonine dehydratase